MLVPVACARRGIWRAHVGAKAFAGHMKDARARVRAGGWVGAFVYVRTRVCVTVEETGLKKAGGPVLRK